MTDDVNTNGQHMPNRADAERMWRLQELFGEALLRDPQQRESFLVEACGEDHDLLTDVKALLVHQPLVADTFVINHGQRPWL